MRQNWIIFCYHCGRNTTIGVAPGKPGFKKVINCSLCNKEIEVKYGSYRYTPNVYHKKSYNLLKI